MHQHICIISGKPCYQAVGMQALEEIRLNMAELTKENVDLIILQTCSKTELIPVQTKQTTTHKDGRGEASCICKVLSSRQTSLQIYLPFRPWSWHKEI